jgi:hypothetical protein
MRNKSLLGKDVVSWVVEEALVEHTRPKTKEAKPQLAYTRA